MKIKLLLGLAALLVAGCAAFFSVTGLGLLFHGASLSVMIMASSLEFAKLVTASYLKQKWYEIGTFLKSYLIIATITLMFLTSMGIFGFLSDAFQQQSLVIEQVDRKISIINNKIIINKSEIERYNNQIKNISQIRNSQETNISKMIDRKEGTSRMTSMIKNADEQIKTFSVKIDSLSDQNTKAYQEIDNIKNQNIDLEKQIGGFRFVADAFNIELKKAVKYFILIIVLVFDPLAIALLLAYNITDKKKEEENMIEEIEIEETETKKRGRPSKKKYQNSGSSQFGEEKYIETFLKDIPKTNFFVEIGAGDGYQNSHTRYFLENGYKGIQIDKDNRGNDEIKQHFVFDANIIPILKTYLCPPVFDFLTIDIMGNEYWILDKILTEFSPYLIVSRFNPYIHPQHKWNSITINYDPNFEYAGDDYFSYTLDAGKKLAEKYGYTIIYQNDETYLYFLKNEYVNEKPDVNYIQKQGIRKSNKTNWITV